MIWPSRKRAGPFGTSHRRDGALSIVCVRGRCFAVLSGWEAVAKQVRDAQRSHDMVRLEEADPRRTVYINPGAVDWVTKA